MPRLTGPDPRLAGLDPRRICVVKPSAFGDVVQTLPVLAPLRRRFPAATVSWVVSKTLAPLVEGHAGIDDVLVFDRKGGAGSWWRLARTLHRRRFDLVFDLQGLLRTGVMTAATAAPVRVGLQTARELSHLACTTILPGTGRDVPARLRYRKILDAVGGDPATGLADLPMTAADRAWADEKLRALPRPLLAVCPGARWETKRWPAVKFAALAARAHREIGVGIVILGSPDERDICAEVQEQLAHLMPKSAVLNLAGGTTLLQLAAVLEAAAWAATNDSGPMHLADAVGTPVVGMFTCTSPVLSGPSPERHVLVSTRLACAAGYHKTCPHAGAKNKACHGELDVERAWAGFLRLVAKSQRAAA